MEKEREKTYPTLSLLWATYTNNGSLEKFCESPPHLSSVGSECSGNSYWGCHFYWGHLFEGQTPWELRRTERGRETERMQLLCRQVTLPEFSRQWGCICRFPKVSLASGLKKKKNEQEEQAHTHTHALLFDVHQMNAPHTVSPSANILFYFSSQMSCSVWVVYNCIGGLQWALSTQTRNSPRVCSATIIKLPIFLVLY